MMSNTEKKRILKNAFSELLDQVLPDDEQITKAEAISVLSKEDLFAVIGDALGVKVQVAPAVVAAPVIEPALENSTPVAPNAEEDEEE